jgi:protein involved in polysaccharide export with SLBB domain
MRKAAFQERRTPSSSRGWGRGLKAFAVSGSVLLLLGVVLAPRAGGQTPATPTPPGADPQTLPTGDDPDQQDQQATGGVNGTANGAAEQAGRAQGALQGGQQAGQFGNQAAAPNQAEQIIGILEEEPEILESLKIQAAQQTGVDPGTISDEAFYDRIRHDATLRNLAVKELTQRGFDLGLDAGTKGVAEGGAAPQGNTGGEHAVQRTRTPPAPYEDRNNAQVVRRPSPYMDLPSVRDLYAQFPSAAAKLRRFGSEAFAVGTAKPELLPADLPAGPDYVLGPGDSLIVNLWGGQSSRLSRTIDRQGQISLPEAGAIPIGGLNILQAEAAIGAALGTQFKNEHVEISLGRVRTVRVYVVGDVERPGAYDVSSLSTPLSALFAAGGPTDRGSLRVLRLFRGAQLVREIDLYDFLLHGVRSEVDRLEPGDTLLVPPVGPQVAVAGMVRRPAIYELKQELKTQQGLDQVVDLAGGVLASANLKQITVERIEAHQRRTMLSLQLSPELSPEIAGGPSPASAEMAAFRVQDGDSVVVAQIAPYNEQMVYLDGHVLRPGKYPYREGMTITDLIRSYQDVMPEPAERAELVRLVPPDLRPETISFSLPDALIGNDPIRLQPFDLVRVFGRYENDSPRVSIEGEVLRPGVFPMSEGMTVAGLVEMAGGFKRSAYRKQADLTTYVVENGENAQLSDRVIDLEKALEGDASADVRLKPGDVVSIRQLTGWKDIGASITVTGEVAHAGTYGIESGERLSAVLKRAGGFREGAYPPGAVLERVQVRAMGEKARLEMIRRIETTPATFKPGLLSAQDQTDMQQASQQQRDQVLAALRSHPANGRLVIRITSDIGQWENTAADVEMRPDDTLTIPKRENFVLVSGQVYNQTAISYVPGKDAIWYLRQAGGVTQSGDKGAVFVVRADGSVVGHAGNLLTGNALNIHMRPGDSIIVPERTVGSQIWKNLISAAQIMSSVAITGAVAGIF